MVFRYRWELAIFRQNERYCTKVGYRAQSAVALFDSVEDMRVSYGPPHLSVLDE